MNHLQKQLLKMLLTQLIENKRLTSQSFIFVLPFIALLKALF